MRFFLLACCLFLLGCDAQVSEEITDSYFNFKIKSEVNGMIRSDAQPIIKVSCEANRTILTFTENLVDMPNDSLAGELILGFQRGDTLGTFELQGIAEKREKAHVGIVALVNQFYFDDLAAQHISDWHRYQTVQSGTLTLESWGTKPDEIIKGKLETTISDGENTITIQGDFGIILTTDNEVCELEM